MDKSEKEEALREWAAVLKNHPKFARAFLAQQAILMEASELGDRLIQVRMCELIELGFLTPFLEFWRKHCKKPRIEVGGVAACLLKAQNPADCFSIPGEDWFNDPFADGRTLPPKPPVPPLAPTR